MKHIIIFLSLVILLSSCFSNSENTPIVETQQTDTAITSQIVQDEKENQQEQTKSSETKKIISTIDDPSIPSNGGIQIINS